MDQDQRARCGGQPQDQGGKDQCVARADFVGIHDQRQGIDHELQPKYAGDRPIDGFHAPLFVDAVDPCEAVKYADPNQIACRFGIGGQHGGWRHGRDPGPAGGEGECGEKHALLALADTPPKLPKRERRKQGRSERMRPEGDQRLH